MRPPSPRLLCLCLALSVLACKRGAGPGAASAPEVVVAPVETRDVEVHTEWIGTTTGYVNAKIYPKIQGYLLKQAYRDGSTVEAGDLLFEIDPRQFQAALDQARGQLDRAQAALGKSEIDVKRYRPLAAQGAVSQQELDDAIQARAADTAQVASARAALEEARLNLQWTQVQSPIGGVAGIAKAQVGDLVSPQTLLTEVSQLDPIKITFPVSEIDYLRFAERVRALEATGHSDNPIELILADGSRYPQPGRFLAVGREVTTTTGTIEVQGLFPNPDNLLRPGQFARVRAVTDLLPGALVISQRAISQLQGLDRVAVVGSDDQVSFRNVKLGPETGNDRVVRDGLEAGERVVVEGLQKIRDGMLVKPVPSPAAGAASPPAAAQTGGGT